MEIAISRIQELFDFDPEAGTIWRKIAYGKRGVTGHVFSNSNIKVDGTHIRTSRIIWALHNGMWPPDGYFIDHINGYMFDNRIVNLRLATPAQNQQNKRGFGTYPKGVTWRDRKEKPWQAKIRVDGFRIHLGSFASMEEAAAAYREAAIQYHGEFANYD